ncbi:DUF934 domain-containing protein [Jeongeupia naejangsanensis]|uniref:DUF934 domain-containing protein n=1 Tax=Jeongeupia naejangsanensis TaxID=613195 RepID=A0ABS2BK48_9NEIS|nr:DUF934 domain-containing protein [Jeongeupia naejangsanensis]MBM3115371.1 DUF934 domain-containing protein [Jeongeupia naejangsanensis]
MPKLIIDRQIVDNTATLLRNAEDGAFAAVPAQGLVIVPLAQYLAQKAELNARGDVGVWFAPDDEPELLGADAIRLPLIAIEFPAFTDGRGFSIGRLLRERYGFTGELRAFGDVFKDTLNYLTRCGFNAFVVRDDKDIVEALKGLDDFTESYQSSVAQPMPLFRRRQAG